MAERVEAYYFALLDISGSSNRTPGVDINAVGTIDGTSVYDVDLDSFEDKPWRKPGDIREKGR
jgi:hypothetical protein